MPPSSSFYVALFKKNLLSYLLRKGQKEGLFFEKIKFYGFFLEICTCFPLWSCDSLFSQMPDFLFFVPADAKIYEA
jgi:hypothetical protein